MSTDEGFDNMRHYIYSQSTGKISEEKTPIGTGYAGNGKDKNNPDSQEKIGKGPLPRGLYTIGRPRDGGHMGPYVLPLTPDKSNQMFGRSAFYIHGDSISRPGTASNGCIIALRSIRERIASSGITLLQVIA